MTSIVITPFDPEHAEELKGFIENEIANAEFEGEDMPSFIRIEDVTAIKQQRDSLLTALRAVLDMPDYDGTQLTSQRRLAAKRMAQHAIRIATQETA